MSYESDVAYMADFIKQFLDKYDRHLSPKYIAGESYGSIRAVGIVSRLQEHHGIYPNGLLLISGLLDYGTLESSGGNEIPYALRLPVLAATAVHHNRVKPKNTLREFLAEIEKFTIEDYLPALFKGNQLSSADKLILASSIEQYTSLPLSYSLATNLRYEVGQVNRVLLSADTLAFGRLDTRLTGYMLAQLSSEYTFDPSLEPLIKAPYMSILYEYTNKILKFDYGNLNYDVISGRTYPWDFNASNKYLSVTDELALSMTKNPALKVWVSGGIYDLGTPYFAAEYSLNHLWIDQRLAKNIKKTWYEGGHMFYHDKAVLKTFRLDAQSFYSIK